MTDLDDMRKRMSETSALRPGQKVTLVSRRVIVTEWAEQ